VFCSESGSRAGALPALFLALTLAACAGGGGELQTFELLPPQEFGAARQARGTLSVALPTALRAIDSERVIIQPTPGEVNYLGGARWSDRLPQLVQARLIESFQNSGRVRTVTRAGDRLTTDYQLRTELREFGVLVGSAPAAQVQISAQLVNERTGRVVASEVFNAQAFTEAVDGPSATAALNTAFGTVVIDLVRWTSTKI
jgi:cholesterol transport system auxiliary component